MTFAQTDALPPGWLPAPLAQVWTLLAIYPVLLAAVIAGAGVVAAGLARAFVLFWGQKITRRTSTDLDDRLLRIGAGVVALVVVYVCLVAAVQVLPLMPAASTIVTRVLVSLLVLQLMRYALRASTLGLSFLGLFRTRFPIVEERTIPLFDLVLTLLIIAVAGYALLKVWAIDATAWLASAGVVGIAVGFAAKDTLANLFGGFFVIADQPYKVGDYVVLDSGERGEITRVGIRSTRMVTRDDVEVTVPNSIMANTKIVNESGGRWERFRLRVKVGVAYGSDVDQVVAVLERVARESDVVVQDPAPRVRMRGFGDSSLDFELLCWVARPSEKGLAQHRLYMDVYKALQRAGLEIPFPQRDVWVRQVPEGLAADGAGPEERPALIRDLGGGAGAEP